MHSFYFLFQIYERVIRCVFRLAGRTKILSLPGINITDNKDHIVKVERMGNTATLQVDFAGKVQGSTGGNIHLMNHGGGALFSGGLRRLTAIKVLQAIVKSDGKAIVQTANGTLISTYSSFAGSLSGVSLITINTKGQVSVKTLKNATLIRQYLKHSIRSIYNSSSQKTVIGSAGVSVTELRPSNSSRQSVQRVLQRRSQQYAKGAAGTGNAAAIGANAVVSGGKISSVGNYGSKLELKKTAAGEKNQTDEGVDESYAGEKYSFFTF